MIETVQGNLVEKAPTHAVLEVNGIGYGLSISLSTYDRLPELASETRLLTYTYVREDRLELFGFADAEEREMFRMLIGVSGIGPNSAQTILSGLSVADLQSAIGEGRAADLTRVRGIGRKTAERIVVDLQDKVSSAGPVSAVGGTAPTAKTGIAEEASLALVALGYAMPAARKAVANALHKNGDDLTLQQLIKQSLQER